MRLRCQYCRLNLTEEHFYLGQQQLTSICDICQSRGLLIGDFVNQQSLVLATARQWVYLGLPENIARKTSTQQVKLSLTKQERKACNSLIDSFDVLPGSWRKQALRQQFYQHVIAWQNRPEAVNLTGNFPIDLENLGCDTTTIFDKNNLDYTTRVYIREKYHYQCQYCGRYGDSVDHKDPVTLSDDNSLANLILSCRECNKLKGSMPYQQFVEWNQEVPATLAKLRQYQQTIERLTRQQKKLQTQLAVARHLTVSVQDRKLVGLRRKIKVLQGLLDGENSDYQKLIRVRHDYIISHYATWKLEQEDN
ncbi:HNH endonuclease [Lapidilactobacillus bayanensis]|uniref:HNH endonuclease n=1 Tax=Lapidilactobacillus bayanensis TaxID=2485998 RepID=UPI000F7ACCF2|nr:HNH endonuclease signature motif containing protein [Lapidilactobacillus bayanensis]